MPRPFLSPHWPVMSYSDILQPFPPAVLKRSCQVIGAELCTVEAERVPLGKSLLCPLSILDGWKETEVLKRSDPGTRLIYKRCQSMQWLSKSRPKALGGGFKCDGHTLVHVTVGRRGSKPCFIHFFLALLPPV